jgi:cytochrome P450
MKMARPKAGRLVVLLSVLATCRAFAPTHLRASSGVAKSTLIPKTPVFQDAVGAFATNMNEPVSIRHHTERKATQLQSSLVAAPVAALKSLSPATRLVLLGAFTVMVLSRVHPKRLLFPGVVPDKEFNEPLPPGQINGCPFVGNLAAFSNMNQFLYERARVADPNTPTPKIWKLFSFLKPTAVFVGSKSIQRVLGREFRPKGSSKKGEGSVSQVTNFGNIEDIFGAESLSFEIESKARYHAVRGLVGQAMTPPAVAEGILALQVSAESAVQKFTQSDGQDIAVESICRDLTLDVAWRQIIGLDLKTTDEIQKFYSDVDAWMKGIVNFAIAMLPKWIMKHLKCFKAKNSLEHQIGAKIDALQVKGVSDGTTMGNMVFATEMEEEGGDSSKNRKPIKLSRQEIIDNIFLLIAAGSETSANTLTCALLLLGMHPQVYDKLVQEQQQLVSEYGGTLNKDLLDESKSPYLDAVIKETMRIMPITGGGIRQVQETMVVDGMQVPKDWYILYAIGLTHKQDPVTQEPDGSDNMSMYTAFQPERWLNNATKPTTEFIPWGAGHRFCLGHVLATAEMKVFLATLARKVKSFDLKTDPEGKWKEGIIRTPADGVVIVPHTGSLSTTSPPSAVPTAVEITESAKTVDADKTFA